MNDDGNNDYLGVLNETDNINDYLVGWSEFYLDNNNILTINKIIDTKIKFTNNNMLLASDNLINTIETKLSNDYIIDNTINGSKLINLVTWKILFYGVNNLI